jgi:pyruvate dehydrogenase E1 component
MLAALEAQRMLAENHGVAADVWSATSYKQLRDDALAVERWNRLLPTLELRRSFVVVCLAGRKGPAIASTDYIRTFADQIRQFVPGRYVALGTDGFGRSDYRVALRKFFEVDRHHVAVAALKALADDGELEPSVVASAIERYGVEADAAAPWTR